MKIYGRKRGSNVAAVPFSLFFLLSGIYGVYLMFLAVPQLRYFFWQRCQQCCYGISMEKKEQIEGGFCRRG